MDVQGKEVGGGLQTNWTVKSKSEKEIQDHQLKKIKIIEGVAVSGWDAPRPPLPSTTSLTGIGANYQVMGTLDRVRGSYTSIVCRKSVKVHCNNVYRELNVERNRRGFVRGR